MTDETVQRFDLEVTSIGGRALATRLNLTWKDVVELLDQPLGDDFGYSPAEAPAYAPQVLIRVKRVGSPRIVLVASPVGFIDPFTPKD